MPPGNNRICAHVPLSPIGGFCFARGLRVPMQATDASDA